MTRPFSRTHVDDLTVWAAMCRAAGCRQEEDYIEQDQSLANEAGGSAAAKTMLLP